MVPQLFQRARPAALAVLLALAGNAAHAGLFDDEEARKAILDLRARIQASDENAQSKIADQGKAQAALLDQVGALRRSLLELNAQLAASMAGGSVAAKTSSRKGKPAAPGTKAWSAFIEHAKATWPERFALPALPKDRMTIAKAIKDEDPEAYRVFCEKYVAEHPAAVAEVAEVAEAEEGAAAAAPVAAAAEKPKRVMSEEQKAKMKAGREAAKAAKEAAKAAGEPVPVKAAPAAKATRCATTDTGMPSSPMTSIDAPSIAKPIGTPTKRSPTNTQSSKVSMAFSDWSRVDHGLRCVLKDPLRPFLHQDHDAVKKRQGETNGHGKKNPSH